MTASFPHLPTSPIGSIDERELDLVVVVALHASEEFRRVFLELMGEKNLDFIGAWRGVYNQFGETDVLCLGKDPDGSLVAILVEDKIDVEFQPDQAKRYQERGKVGQDSRHWARFVTCLCAPRKFAEFYADQDAWDRLVFFDDLALRLKGGGGSNPLVQLTCDALERAVSKNKNGFLPNVAVTGFWQCYQAFCQASYPSALMTALPKAQSINEPWPRFAKNALPDGIKLEHKAAKGFVDLTFQKRSADELRLCIGGLIPPDMQVVKTPPSAAVRLVVPVLRSTEPFSEQLAGVRLAIEAVLRMLEVWRGLSDHPDLLKAAQAGDSVAPSTAELEPSGMRPSSVSHLEEAGGLETSEAVFALLEKQAHSADLRAVDRENLLDAIKRRDMELVVVLFKEFRLPLPLGRSESRAIN